MSEIQPGKKLRAIEFALVIFVAFALSVYNSIFPARPFPSLIPNYINNIILQVSSLAVLVYVLFRQGRSLAQIGFTFSWLDIPISVILAGLGYYADRLLRFGMSQTIYYLTGNAPDTQPHNVRIFYPAAIFASLGYALINPFKEELIVRAFTISEVKYLTGSSLVAVLVSVALQTTYHFYQGPLAALSYVPMFLIFSLYYVRSGRITPVVLAHLYFDAVAWVEASMR